MADQIKLRFSYLFGLWIIESFGEGRSLTLSALIDYFSLETEKFDSFDKSVPNSSEEKPRQESTGK
ncbi:MAG TPA: hypothetical protein VFS68_04980 [Candidatus Udaeobacter sp.]|nr:hypothetical protein [Candidatus Udaeobacter sp.]